MPMTEQSYLCGVLDDGEDETTLQFERGFMEPMSAYLQERNRRLMAARPEDHIAIVEFENKKQGTTYWFADVDKEQEG